MSDWTENRPTRGLGRIDLGELFRYRELIFILALRDLKVRYKQAALGVAWAWIQPLVGVLIFAAVFARVDAVHETRSPYLLHALLGFALWSYFSGSVTRASACLVENAALVSKVWFPRLCAPIAALLPGLVDLALTTILLGGLMVWFGHSISTQICLLPLILLPLMALTLGLGAWSAAMHVRFRDVRHVIPVALQFLFFASPVVYPSHLLSDSMQRLFAWNPLTGILAGARWAVLGEPWPESTYWLACGLCALVLLLGLQWFAATDRRFADVI